MERLKSAKPWKPTQHFLTLIFGVRIMVKYNSELQIIICHVTVNKIGTPGATALGQALHVNTTLTKLNLGGIHHD